MTDQPKPNQPTQPSPPAQAQSAPKEAPSETGKVSSPPPPTNEAKPAEAKPDATTNQAAEVKPEPKPDSSAAPVSSAPTKPANNDSPSSQIAQPSSTDSKASPTVPPAKPVTTETSAPSSTPSAQPANADKSAAETAVPVKPTSPETSAPSPAQPVSAETNKPQAVSTSPTEKRDISEDPTVPGKPSLNIGTTRPVTPPSSNVTDAEALLSPRQTVAPSPADKEDTIPPQSSAAKVTQRFNEPSSSGPTVAGTICPSCGHRNRPGTLICDNCGTNLVGGVKSAVGTRDLLSVKEAAETANEPLIDAVQLSALESAGGTVFSEDMVLRIEIEGGATPMLVYPKQEIILGRRDPNTGTLPDVDMTAYSGYRMGVSRTHASIHLQDKQLNLSDRGSSNGTFLNGTRLVAHRPYPLKDGDEIRLGQMVLRIYFQSNKNRK